MSQQADAFLLPRLTSFSIVHPQGVVISEVGLAACNVRAKLGRERYNHDRIMHLDYVRIRIGTNFSYWIRTECNISRTKDAFVDRPASFNS